MSEEADRTLRGVSNLDDLVVLLNRLDRAEEEDGFGDGGAYKLAGVDLDHLPTFGGDRPRGRPCEGQPDSYSDGLLPFSWDEKRVLVCPGGGEDGDPWKIWTREEFREEILDGMLPDLWVENGILDREEADLYHRGVKIARRRVEIVKGEIDRRISKAVAEGRIVLSDLSGGRFNGPPELQGLLAAADVPRTNMTWDDILKGIENFLRNFMPGTRKACAFLADEAIEAFKKNPPI